MPQILTMFPDFKFDIWQVHLCRYAYFIHLAQFCAQTFYLVVSSLSMRSEGSQTHCSLTHIKIIHIENAHILHCIHFVVHAYKFLWHVNIQYADSCIILKSDFGIYGTFYCLYPYLPRDKIPDSLSDSRVTLKVRCVIFWSIFCYKCKIISWNMASEVYKVLTFSRIIGLFWKCSCMKNYGAAGKGFLGYFHNVLRRLKCLFIFY